MSSATTKIMTNRCSVIVNSKYLALPLRALGYFINKLKLLSAANIYDYGVLFWMLSSSNWVSNSIRFSREKDAYLHFIFQAIREAEISWPIQTDIPQVQVNLCKQTLICSALLCYAISRLLIYYSYTLTKKNRSSFLSQPNSWIDKPVDVCLQN